MISSFRTLFAPPRHLILLILAAWIGLALAEKRTKQHGIMGTDLINLAFYGSLGFVLGGRLLSILQNISVYARSPIGMVSINPDLFDAFGGISTSLIVAFIYAHRNNLPLWSTLDAFIPFFAMIGIGLGLKDLAAGTAFGTPTRVVWAIELWNAERHPTQIYVMVASILTFSLFWYKNPNSISGIDFLTFACLISGLNLFILAFRADANVIFNGMKLGQIIAWIVLAAGFLLIEIRLAAENHG